MIKKLIILGLLFSLIFVVFSGCTQQEDDGTDQNGDELSFTLDFVRKIAVADGYYPGIIFTDNQFYVSYEVARSVFLKVYDENFTATGEEYQLTGDEGADHQMAYGNGSFYLVTSFNLIKFDSAFNEVLSVPFFDDLPSEVRELWSEVGGLDDMLFCYDDGFIYLGIPAGNQKKDGEEKQDVPGDLYIQQYNEDLEVVSEVTLESVGNIPGSSMLFYNGMFLVVCADKHWDDSSLIVRRYDDWEFVDSFIISAVSDANEEFAMGVVFDDGRYFVGYQHITGDLFMPSEGDEYVIRTDVMLKVFDSEWSLLGEVMVTDDVPESVKGGHTGRPHLVVVGNVVYVAYDSMESGDTEIFVKEYEIIS